MELSERYDRMTLTSLYGTALLALQDALRREVSGSGGVPTVPNFAVVSIDRERFMADYGGTVADQVERFKRDLAGGVREFLAAHGWSVEGRGGVVINLLLRSMPEDCRVQVRRTPALFLLKVTDDQGERTVKVQRERLTVGREHENAPVGFLALRDGSGFWSRCHLEFRYADLQLTVTCLGKNPTTLNGDRLAAHPISLKAGDCIACGSHTVTLVEFP